MRRRLVWLAVFGLVSGVFLGIGAIAANPSVSDEDGFVSRVADERDGADLPGYSIASDLVDVARRHAVEMQSQQRLFHNPSLASDVSGWDAVGENVGRGLSVEDIHRALMASPSHRENILSPRFTQIGVGVVVDEDDGELWMVQVFRRPSAPADGGEDRATESGSSAPGPGSTASQPTPRAAEPAATAPSPAVAAAVAGVGAPVPTIQEEPATTLPVPLGTDAPGPVASSRAVDPATAASGTDPDRREVEWPVALAASLLMLVVGALAVQVGGDRVRALAPHGRRPSLLDVWELALAR
ncbi:MAG TPA: CAP domain-containing protein [Acidimicrobiales bacterium]|nr:CAP domain-containing protein [Acidimicrobiales bacterium]